MILESGARFSKLQKGFGLLQNKKASSTRRTIRFAACSWQNAGAVPSEGQGLPSVARFARRPGEGDRKGLPSSESISARASDVFRFAEVRFIEHRVWHAA